MQSFFDPRIGLNINFNARPGDVSIDDFGGTFSDFDGFNRIEESKSINKTATARQLKKLGGVTDGLTGQRLDNGLQVDAMNQLRSKYNLSEDRVKNIDINDDAALRSLQSDFNRLTADPIYRNEIVSEQVAADQNQKFLDKLRLQDQDLYRLGVAEQSRYLNSSKENGITRARDIDLARLQPLDISSTLESTVDDVEGKTICLLYTSPSPRDQRGSRMPSSA